MKIINSKEEKKKMNNECPNCGYKMSAKDKACKYCGTKNENYSKLIDFVEGVDKISEDDGAPVSPQTTKSLFLIFGIVCLFVCLPLGIILLLLSSRIDKDN